MVRLAPVGMDRGNPGTGFATRSSEMADQDQEAPKGLSLYSFRECLDDIVGQLSRKGYRMFPTFMGKWCGYEIYKHKQLTIPGLLQPEDFGMLVPIYPHQVAERCTFFAHLREIIESGMSQADGKHEMQVWQKVWTCFQDRLMDTRSEVFTAGRGFATEVQKTVTLTGLKGHYKVVPPLSWFPEELRDYPVRNLLTLFPDAEASALMLILGRLVAGASLTDTAEGRLEHTMRAMALIIGNQPGLGKSTFLRYLTTTLQLLGYTQVEINSDFNKFGWASVAQADLASIDDLTNDTQKKLLSDSRIKTIVTNNNLKAEEKGVAAVDLRAVSVVLGCSNKSDYSHYIGLDAGVLSRLNQLDTYNGTELQQRWGVDRPYDLKSFWEQESAALGCSPETLMALLLRRCLDMFLEATGHTIDARGALRRDASKDVLESTMLALRAKYRIDVSLKHAEELPMIASRLIGLTLAHKLKADLLPQYIEAVSRIDFSPDLLLLVVRLFLECREMNKGAFTGIVPQHFSWDMIPYILPKVRDFSYMRANKSLESAFTAIVSELKSNKGFGYPGKSSHYQPDWMAERRMVGSLVESYQEMLQGVSVPPKLMSICDDAFKLFEHLV